MHPLRPRMGRRSTLMIVLWIWTASVSLSLPNMIFSTTADVAGGRIVCYGAWPDGDTPESHSEYVHSLVLMVLTYILPMCSMAFTYTRVGLTLWGSRSIGEHTPRQEETIKSKRKVVKMMIVVVTIFGVCWLPYHVYFILVSQVPEINNYVHIQNIYLGIYWLAMSNSMYNPIIYCWLNNRFRNGFKRVFSHLLPCCCRFAKGQLETDTLRIRYQTTRFSCSGSPELQHRISCDGPNQINLRAYGSEISSNMSRNTNSSSYQSLCNGASANAKNKNGATSGVNPKVAKFNQYPANKIPVITYQYV